MHPTLCSPAKRARRPFTALTVVALLTAAGGQSALAAAALPPAGIAAQLRDKAMSGQHVAYSWVSELTTRFGPRPAGSASERQAAAWAVARACSVKLSRKTCRALAVTVSPS